MTETAAILHAGRWRFSLARPLCMGIINVTPDSFSDGAELARTTGAASFRVDRDKVLARARSMVEAGADILDIGGESTRPGARPVSQQEELDRILPALEAVGGALDVCISVDSSSPEVMAEALKAGAGMINDVRALRREGALEVIAATPVAVCLMHMRGEPGTMQGDTDYADVTHTVANWLRQRAGAVAAAGVDSSRIVLDPGFGFGKTTAQNYELLARLPELAALGYPLLAGISRKSMLGAVIGRPPAERGAASVAAAMLALQGGAAIIRTHDVSAIKDAIGVYCAFRDTQRGILTDGGDTEDR